MFTSSVNREIRLCTSRSVKKCIKKRDAPANLFLANLNVALTKKKVMGVGKFLAARIFFPLIFPFYKFFRQVHEYFLGLLGVYECFSFHFPLHEYFLGCSYLCGDCSNKSNDFTRCQLICIVSNS